MADAHQASLGKRLRQERELRHWTQEQLAQKIGRSVPSINRWEHDRAEPQLDALKELTALFGKPPEQWGTSRWNVPFLRNPYFTGREQFLVSLHRTLTAEKTATLSQSRAISGLGGIGKTQIAIEYAYRYAREYEAVLWAQADSREILVSEFARLSHTLDLPEKEEQDQWRIVKTVKRWLQEHSAWLLILDNADDLAVINDFLPRGMGGATLVTTRSQVTGKIARSLTLEKMEMSEGIRLVLRRARLLEDDEPLETVSAAIRTAAHQLVEKLDSLPLALDQAGAYLEETGCGLSEYLTLYEQHRLTLLKRKSSMASDYPHSVASTWTLSFSQVKQANPAAADLLHLCAFLAPDAIPEEILTGGAAALEPPLQKVVTRPLLLNEVIQILRRYSLVKRDAEANLLNLHRLVQVVLKESLDPPVQRQWAERAVLSINATFPTVEYSAWSQCERLLSQALTAAQLIEQYQMMSEEAGRLLDELATYLQERARYQEAEQFYQRALHIREQMLGPEHLDVAMSLKGLANHYWQQSKYEEAKPLYQRALHIREQRLGPEHSDVAVLHYNLAILYYDQGKYEEAEPLYQRALHIWEQALGMEHTKVSYALNGLAILYYQQGKYTEAEPLYERALRIREQQLGPEHPHMTTSYHNLAELYLEQGKYAEAEPLYERALRIREQQLGPEHPNVASPLNGLANLYLEQGKYTEAEPLYERALRIREQHLGPEHPDTAETMHHFARYCEAQGNIEEAYTWYTRALAIREQSLGVQHPRTTQTLTRLIALLHTLGQHEEAAQLEAAQNEQRPPVNT